MRKYEAMYIISPNLDEAATKETVEKFQNLITSHGGEIENLKEMGKRRLAYEIEEFREGFYVLITFKSQPDFIAELERVFRITDSVIRYIIVKDVK